MYTLRYKVFQKGIGIGDLTKGEFQVSNNFIPLALYRSNDPSVDVNDFSPLSFRLYDVNNKQVERHRLTIGRLLTAGVMTNNVDLEAAEIPAGIYRVSQVDIVGFWGASQATEFIFAYLEKLP
ncbi:MAG TPA: hypothetical protein VGD89_09690 [Flavipsychrobacter sp.]